MTAIRPGRAGADSHRLPPTRVDRLVRADDQLRLIVEFLNLDVDPQSQTLVAVDPEEPFTGVRLSSAPSTPSRSRSRPPAR